MTRMMLGLAACLALAACGSGSDSRNQRGVSVERQAFSTGQISRACMTSGRKAANTRLCGCLQAVADETLRSRSDQRMAAGFFGDPHEAQVIRQSDNPHHEDFWKRYKGFSGEAERVCKGL
ncbi:arginine transporter [Sagittula sp. NFXS13]|uniref:arginine transporter n=1 Tax=Sagittula sp. NFXS13 TaxID=2819095 RepID=UPI0032DFBD36